MVTRSRSLSRHASVPANVSGAVLLTLVINGVIFAAGWSASDQARIPAEFAPPGWVVGLVWVLLFAAMGAARALVVQRTTNASIGQRLIELLIGVCALYPFYTAGLDNLTIALIGTAVSFVVAVAAAGKARRHSRGAAGLVLLVAAWTVFAAALIVREIQLN